MVDRPSARGGRVDDVTTGASFRDIGLTARAEGRSVGIAELTATDRYGGRIAGKGTVGLDASLRPQMDVALNLARARVLDGARLPLTGFHEVVPRELAVPRRAGRGGPAQDHDVFNVARAGIDRVGHWRALYPGGPSRSAQGSAAIGHSTGPRGATSTAQTPRAYNTTSRSPS